ncbi:MAG: hypothetical protein KC636_20580 [Myxococcales bacterium]|nr:hypothetical protein [Myxococcales bacterium]
MPRTLALVAALTLAACTSESKPAPPAATKATSPAPEGAPAETTQACALSAEPQAAPAVHPDLMAVAAQYFHPAYRGGFDAYRGGEVFPWFDRYNLERPTLAPAGLRIAASTAQTLFAVSQQGELVALRREGLAATELGQRLYPVEAIERADGEAWVLGRGPETLQLVHLTPTRAADVIDLGLPTSTRDVRLALTADERPALLWVAREEERLRVLLSWSLAPAEAIVLDQVTLPIAVAELAEITDTGLSAAADGPRGLGFAWRPITDTAFLDVGSAESPPQTPAAAEVRWGTIAPDGEPGPSYSHKTRAQPLGGTSGVGPWPLSGNGLQASRVGGRATFVWDEADAVYGARSIDAAATRLSGFTRSPLLVPRERGEALELLLLDSSPGVAALRLGCS